MREAQIGSNLIDRLARLGLHYLDFNIFRQYIGSIDTIVSEIPLQRDVSSRVRFRHRITTWRGSIVYRVAQSAWAQSFAQHFLITSREQKQEYRNHDIINISRHTESVCACTRYITLHVYDSRCFNYDKSRACAMSARAFIFIVNSKNRAKPLIRAEGSNAIVPALCIIKRMLGVRDFRR